MYILKFFSALYLLKTYIWAYLRIYSSKKNVNTDADIMYQKMIKYMFP